MDLAARFRRVACSIRIPVAAMVKGRRYHIEHAEKGDDNIVMTLRRYLWFVYLAVTQMSSRMWTLNKSTPTECACI
jgi:hypothetical protein